MKESTWRQLDEEFAKYPVMVAGPTDPSSIRDAARTLGCVFDRDFAEFLRRYGGALVGSNPVLGLLQAEAMGADTFSVVDVTLRFREQGWKGTAAWYVVSIDGAGNPVGMDEHGRVWLSDHNSGEVAEVAPTFEEFLLKLLNPAEPDADLDRN